MTQKDYVLIAEVIKRASELDAIIEVSRGTEIVSIGHYTLTERFAQMLAADNPRFDRAKFQKACGLVK
jgi:hypothetical protein